MHLLRTVPRAVWAVTLLFGVLLTFYSQLAPLGRSPDEAGHVDLILWVRAGEPYPQYDEHHSGLGATMAWASYAPGFENAYDPQDQGLWLVPEAAPDRSSRRAFEEWGGAEPTGVISQLPQHPSLYYRTAAAALGAVEWVVPGTSAPLDRTWHTLRLFSVALVVPLPLLCWAASRRLGATGTAPLAAAVVPLCVPQLHHIGSSVNNDNLLVLLSAIDAVLLAGVIRGDQRRSIALAVGAVTGLALLTKAFAVVLLPWIALAYGYRLRTGHERRRAATNVAIGGGTAAAMSAWWYLRNLVRHGHPSPSVLDGTFGRAPAGFEPDTLWYARRFTTTVLQRFWGNFGYYEVPLPVVLVIAGSVLFLLATAIAFYGARSRDDGGRSSPSAPSARMLAVMAAPVVLLIGVIFLRAYALYRSSGLLPFLQGRYLFGAMVSIAVVVGFGAAHVLRRWAPVTLLAVGAVMHLGAVRGALRAWWAEPDASVRRSVEAMVAWSPWPSAITLGLAVALAVAAVLTTVASWTDARDRSV